MAVEGKEEGENVDKEDEVEPVVGSILMMNVVLFHPS